MWEEGGNGGLLGKDLEYSTPLSTREVPLSFTYNSSGLKFHIYKTVQLLKKNIF